MKATNLLIGINVVIFIIMVLVDKSLFAPSSKALFMFGGSEPVALATGEWWRLLSANFVHFGLLHLALNMFALHVIGLYIEKLVKWKKFLVLYFVSGIGAFIVSNFLNLHPSSGASGAIFGLVGAGVVLENYYLFYNKSHLNFLFGSSFKEKWKIFFSRRPFSFIAVLNIFIAVVLNLIASFFDSFPVRIDNAAHIGGMLVGALLFISLIISMTKLTYKKFLSKTIFLIVLLSIFSGGYVLTRTDFIKKKFISKAQNADKDPLSYYYYSKAISIDPHDSELRFHRSVLLLKNGEYSHAKLDLMVAALSPPIRDKIKNLEDNLIREGDLEKAVFLQEILESIDSLEIR
jgi:membrane associated rhomboid family serine protease